MVALLPPSAMGILVLAVVLAGTVLVVRLDVNKAYGLGLLLMGIYALQMIEVFFLEGVSATVDLGLRSGAFLAGDTPWSILSHMYLHSIANPLHIVGNLFILLTAGPALEDRIGPRRFLVIYFAAGILGGASHLLLAELGVISGRSLALGASGAIFGVLTAFAMVAPREKLPMPIYIIVWLPAYVVLLLFLGFNVVLIFTGSNVAWWAHFAGFIGGLLASVWLERASDPGGRWRVVDVEPLRALATTEAQENVLERLESIEGSTEDDRTWTQVWLERFADRTPCPRCGGAIHLRGARFVCEEGDWEILLGEREMEEDL